MKSVTRASLVATVFFAASAFGTPDAQADCQKRQSQTNEANDFVVHKDSKGKKVITIATPIVLCAKPPAPEVVYVVQATMLDYAWVDLRRDFLPKIRRSVKQAPF